MEKKYQIDTPENKVLLKENARALWNFGRRFPSEGGSSYYLGDDGTPCVDKPRETWITSRMVHSYSMGAMNGIDGCGELVDQALKGLLGG
ncbi:MAG: AGE family epimerase/isomerase [Lachnospiraceae bacterium]|nr:AGE family epimerase/isomerase [Lachnospiraceae bacterium]